MLSAQDKRDAERARANLTPKEIADYLERPGSFGLSSTADHAADMFVTWSLGPVIEHRDSDVITRANAKALRKHLASMPEMARYWTITRCGHWGVGWVEHLSFQVLTKRGEPTLMAGIVKAWFDALESYSVADEQTLSELESEDEGQAWDSYARADFVKTVDEVLNTIDPEHEHDSDPYFEDESAFEIWLDGCDAFNLYVEHEGSGPHFPIERWGKEAVATDHPRYPWSDFARDARAKLATRLRDIAAQTRISVSNSHSE